MADTKPGSRLLRCPDDRCCLGGHEKYGHCYAQVDIKQATEGKSTSCIVPLEHRWAVRCLTFAAAWDILPWQVSQGQTIHLFILGLLGPRPRWLTIRQFRSVDLGLTLAARWSCCLYADATSLLLQELLHHVITPTTNAIWWLYRYCSFSENPVI